MLDPGFSILDTRYCILLNHQSGSQQQVSSIGPYTFVSRLPPFHATFHISRFTSKNTLTTIPEFCIVRRNSSQLISGIKGWQKKRDINLMGVRACGVFLCPDFGVLSDTAQRYNTGDSGRRGVLLP